MRRAALLGPWAFGALFAVLARADSPVLARVGSERIELEQFSRRAARLSPFQWQELGQEWPERRRALLERVLIPELLLAGHRARPGGLLAPGELALDRALREAIYAEAARHPITPAELSAYYAEWRRHYETPAQLLLFRILLPDEAAARAVISELSTPKDATFRALARERSIDTATRLRAGNLGYVAADGQSHYPQLRVAPALFAAAERVKDGELVPEPVLESGGFAVVWRKGSRAASVRALAEAEPEIRLALIERRYFAELGRLIAGLRQGALTEYRAEGLGDFEPSAEDARPSPTPRTKASSGRAVDPVPKPSERGLR